MPNKLIDLIDFEKVDILLEGFNKSTGFVTAILDLDGNILSKSGWRQICTDFHRVHPQASKKCTISDTELAGKLAEGEKFHFYKCLNGLVDVAVPIVINGEHMANLFSGQFFFEEPDREFFRKQAEKYGFNQNSYLQALEKVPVVSEEKVKTAMDFLLNMTQLISENAFQKLNQAELHKTIRESEEKFKNVFNNSVIGKSITTIDGKLETNESFRKILGYSKTELSRLKWQEITHKDDVQRDEKIIKSLISGENTSSSWQKRYIHKYGNIVWVDISTTLNFDEKGKPDYFITSIIDITEAKQAEEDRQKFVMLADSSSEFIGMCDLDLTPIYVNPAGIQMVGLPDLEAACQVKVQDYFFPEDQQFIAEEFFPRVMREGHGDVEIRLRHFQTGKEIWMFYYLYKVCDSSGRALGWATVSRDITERKQAEEALLKSEQEFRSLAESMPQIVWTTRADGWNTYFNQQWVDYTGMTLEESYGHGWNKPFHPDDQQRAWDAWQNATQNNGVYSIEARLRRYDGEYLWWLVRGVPLINDEGKILKWFGTCTNIEDIKQSEAILVESEKIKSELLERLNDAQQIAKIGSWEWNLETNEVWWSDETYHIFGVSRQDYTPGFEENGKFIHPDDIEKYGELFNHSLTTGEPLNYNFRLIDGEGVLKFCNAGGKIISDHTGRAIRFIGTVMDITEQKMIENALRLSEEKFEESFRLSPYLVSLTSMDGKVIEVNDMIFETFGYTREEFLGNNTTALPIWVHPEERDAFIKQLREDGILREMEVQYRKKSGEIGDFLLSATIIELNEEKILLSIIHDITARKQAEKQIKKLNEELEEKVMLRTRELEKKYKELERINNLFVDRELRMVQLKKKIKELENRMNENP